MSISREEFERGKKDTPLTKKVLDFLKKNKGRAFESKEIREGVGYKLDSSNMVFHLGGFLFFDGEHISTHRFFWGMQYFFVNLFF